MKPESYFSDYDLNQVEHSLKKALDYICLLEFPLRAQENLSEMNDETRDAMLSLLADMEYKLRPAYDMLHGRQKEEIYII